MNKLPPPPPIDSNPESESPEAIAWLLEDFRGQLSSFHERLRCNYTNELYNDDYAEHTLVDIPSADERYAIARLKNGETKLISELLRSGFDLHPETLTELADYLDGLPEPKRRKQRARPVEREQYRSLFSEAISRGDKDLVGFVCEKSGMERTVVYDELSAFYEWITERAIANEYKGLAEAVRAVLRDLPVRDNSPD